MPVEDASQTMTQHLHLHARRPRVSAAAVPSGATTWSRAMAIEPAERFCDPRSLLTALRDSAPTAAVEVSDDLDGVWVTGAIAPNATRPR